MRTFVHHFYICTFAYICTVYITLAKDRISILFFKKFLKFQEIIILQTIFETLKVSGGKSTKFELLLTGEKESTIADLHGYKRMIIASLIIIILFSTICIKLLKKPTTETAAVKKTPKLQALNLTLLLSLASSPILRQIFQAKIIKKKSERQR